MIQAYLKSSKGLGECIPAKSSDNANVTSVLDFIITIDGTATCNCTPLFHFNLVPHKWIIKCALNEDSSTFLKTKSDKESVAGKMQN